MLGGNSISGASTKKELTLGWPGYLRPSMADDLHYDQVEQKPYRHEYTRTMSNMLRQHVLRTS